MTSIYDIAANAKNTYYRDLTSTIMIYIGNATNHNISNVVIAENIRKELSSLI